MHSRLCQFVTSCYYPTLYACWLPSPLPIVNHHPLLSSSTTIVAFRTVKTNTMVDAANLVAACFLALGQDPAQVVESANCM